MSPISVVYCFIVFNSTRLRDITSSLRKQNAMLEELRDIFLDKKRRPKRDEPAEDPNMTEFYV